jgi:hypothetical protein
MNLLILGGLKCNLQIPEYLKPDETVNTSEKSIIILTLPNGREVVISRDGLNIIPEEDWEVVQDTLKAIKWEFENPLIFKAIEGKTGDNKKHFSRVDGNKIAKYLSTNPLLKSYHKAFVS